MTTKTEEIKKEKTAEGAASTEVNQRPKAKHVYKLNSFKSFSGEIADASGEPINSCFQCKKCSNGCPITYAMDYQPHQIIQMMQLGLEEKVLSSNTIWLCSACETCGTRCPNEIQLSDMMDALRQKAEKSGYRVGHRQASVFHRAFLASIEKYGRVYELGMMRQFLMKSGGIIAKMFNGSLFKDAGLGMKMLRRGKLPLSAHKIKGVSEVKKLFKNV